ncbi:hypothetical protein, conserved [Leishmania lindenbergi]|uniref:Uncharacterized protein n=1 Tax=Leishmania lindenbergi TaxID=651832 RepID=A0AAW3ASN0_9TRYP
MGDMLNSSDVDGTVLPWTPFISSDVLGETMGEQLLPSQGDAKEQHHRKRQQQQQQQQQALSKAFISLPTPVQSSPIPFITSMDVSAFFSGCAGGGTPQPFSLPLQQRPPPCISQSLSNQFNTVSQYTASSTVHALDTNNAPATDFPLVDARSSFAMPLNASSANQADGENLSRVVSSTSNHGRACGDGRSRASRQTHVHGGTSFFSTSLSSRPSSPLSPSPPAAEEHISGYTSLYLPTAAPSFACDDDYTHAMNGQVAFVERLCEGTSGHDGDGNGEPEVLGMSCDMSGSPPQQCLQQSASLEVRSGSFGGLLAASGSQAVLGTPVVVRPFTEYEVAASLSEPARPAPPPLSTFEPLSTAMTYPNEYCVCVAANTAGAVTARDTPIGSNISDASMHAQSQASSGNLQTPLIPSQGMVLPPQQQQQPIQRVHQQQQQQRLGFTPSPLPTQMWTSNTRVASAEDLAALSSSQHQYQQQLQASVHSQSSSLQYSVGATSGAATVIGQAFSSSGTYTTSPAQSFSAANGYYTRSSTPPSGGPAHMIMLLPSFSENSFTGNSTQAQQQQQQQHLYAMQVPAQTPPTSEGASAPLCPSAHGSGAVQSPSMQPLTSTTMSAGGGVGGVTLFYVAAPAAFAGFPHTAASSQVNASSPSGVSGYSCAVSMAQTSAPERPAPSSHYVTLPPSSPANNSQSQLLPLQEYTGYVASQQPNVGMAAVSEQAALASLHARTSSPVGKTAAANLPHVTSIEAASLGSKAAGPTCPGIRSVVSSTNTDTLRKQINVHGAMLNVLHYYPYNENSPPAPTAHIVTGPGSASNSTVLQSLGGSSWPAQSMSSNLERNLDGSWRSLDSGKSQNTAEVFSCAFRGDTSTLENAPALPIFIQMFPCELRDRVGLLNRVIEATCGRNAGLAQSFETRSETSFIAHVRTNNVWELIYKLRCRVLMDRFGFWYAADIDQYVRMKEYCEGVRRLPQQTRHFQTDGLPCMPLVVELSRSVDRGLVTENTAPRCFDELVPIAAVDRHRIRLQGPSSVHSGHSSASMNGMLMAGSGASTAGGTVFLTNVGGDVRPLHGGSPVLLTNEGHMMMMPPHMMSGLANGSYRGGGSTSGSCGQVIYADPHFFPPPFTK